MTQFKNILKLNSSSYWCYFDAPSTNYDYFPLAHIFTITITKLILIVTKMILMSNLDDFGTTNEWLYILKEELSKDFTLDT